MSAQNEQCREANERILEVLDGTADAVVFDHIAACDTCRDLRFEGERAGELVARAGLDFRAPEGFAEPEGEMVPSGMLQGAAPPRAARPRARKNPTA